MLVSVAGVPPVFDLSQMPAGIGKGGGGPRFWTFVTDGVPLLFDRRDLAENPVPLIQ